MRIKLGCIADDFTGATDLANNLVQAGMRVWQVMGTPDEPLAHDADAVVIALKSRTVPAADAVAESLQALAWLRAAGAEQVYFKYCSTFDSTSKGNIGPVAEALMDALDTDFTIATPAFPDNGRSVFKGHLFVGDVPLHESGMRHHPLTPMTDSNLVRVLQAQCRRKVGLIDHAVVSRGAAAITERIEQLRAEGVGLAILDAISNQDLIQAAPALARLPLVTAGSGVAIGLPANFGIAPGNRASALPAPQGYAAIVSGSCSVATNAQVADFQRKGHRAIALDALRLAGGADVAQEILAEAVAHLPHGPVLVYSTAASGTVSAVQQRLGREQAGQMVEDAIAAICRGLVLAGVGRLIVAGGETSGACVQALGIRQMQIGAQIDPGVPWCFAETDAASSGGIHLTLKSGNFGGVDFFTRAFQQLQDEDHE